jgi:hypothetical protein
MQIGKIDQEHKKTFEKMRARFTETGLSITTEGHIGQYFCFASEFTCVNFKLRLNCTLNTEENAVVIVICFLQVPEKRRQAVSKLIMRINPMLRAAQLALDFDGTLMLGADIALGDKGLDIEDFAVVMREVIYHSYQLVPAFFELVESGIRPSNDNESTKRRVGRRRKLKQ